MKISVQRRISIAFITLVLLNGIIWLISDYRNHLLELKFDIITEKNQLLNTILEARRYEKNYFLYFNEKDLKEAITYTTTAASKISEIIKAYRDYASSQNLLSYQDELKRYKNSLLELQRHYRENHLSGDIEGLMAGSKQKQSNIRALGQEITSDLEQMVRKERLSVNRIVKESRIYSFLGVSTVFALSVFVAFFLIFKVNRPLRQIGRAVRKIAAGDYEKIPPLNTNDEFDEFVQSLNTMISEVNKRNEQLVQSRKMASLGTLTSGVAHELNNPLNNISTSLQIAVEEMESGDPAYNKELLTDAEAQIERARDIVRALLEFSRERTFKPAKVNIKNLIEESLKLIKGEMPGSVEVEIDVDEDMQTVMDFRRMQQVLINLILNAVHAMGDEGKLTIRGIQYPENNEICLQIQDTGKGIPAEYKDKIFDPFFSTKEVGKGTGLGLSVSHGIIQNHGGRIDVESEEGAGTTFFIYLPMRTDKIDDEASMNESDNND
ncbi:MAG: HAMP domain-containing protein [Desulfobacterales bacterium]|nr:HAMP domain-containing protein [Desulfobacterales bacterium]